jgi:hypothetical protein
MESLAGKAPYLNGVGVAINREMMVWNNGEDSIAYKCFVLVWDGSKFVISYTAMHTPKKTTIDNACEIPVKEKRWKTHAEIAQTLVGKYAFKHFHEEKRYTTHWDTERGIHCYKACLIADLGTERESWTYDPMMVEGE